MVLERFSNLAAVAEKLAALGGHGRLKEREWRIRVRLGWHRMPATTIRHMLYGERRPSVDEAREIEAAHVRYCAEKVRQNAAENEALFQQMRSALAAMQESDPDFYGPHIEAVRNILFPNGDMGSQNRSKD